MIKSYFDGIGDVYIIQDEDDWKAHIHEKQDTDETWFFPYRLVEDDGQEVMYIIQKPTKFPYMFVGGSIPVNNEFGNTKARKWFASKASELTAQELDASQKLGVFMQVYRRLFPADFE